MGGGIQVVTILVVSTIFFKYFDFYNDSVTQEWADASPEDQTKFYFEFTSKLATVGIVGLALRNTKDYIYNARKKGIGRDVHQKTLSTVLFSTVNTFFDVTPIGKILQIFTEDLEVLRARVALATTQAMLGDPRGARPTFEAALEILESSGPPGHPVLLDARNGLAAVLLMMLMMMMRTIVGLRGFR